MINISVVLYCNPPQQIQNLISDLILNEQTKHIYLIDNSPNNDLQKLTRLDSRIIYFHNPANPGYGTAHNIAIQKSITEQVEYHVVVNPDIRLGRNVLSQLFDFMNSNRDVANVMPDILYPDGSRQNLCKLLPTPLSLFSRRFLPRLISNKFDQRYNLLSMDYTQETNVPLLSGCFMFLRVSALAEVGGFDSRYFMYLEDFDLNRRLHEKYRTMYYPHVQVIHEYAKDSYKNKKLMIYHIKSAVSYFNKYGWFIDHKRRLINKRFLKSQNR